MKEYSVIGAYINGNGDVGQLVCELVVAASGEDAIQKTYEQEERKNQGDFRVIAAIPGRDLDITFND